MILAIRNRLIALGFAFFCLCLRIKRVVLGLGQPRLELLDHITLPVTDLDTARRFYCELLGGIHMMTIDAVALQKFGRPAAPDDGDGVFHHSILLGGVTRVDLFLQRDGQPTLLRGHPHIAFRVPPGDMIRWKKRLEECGVPTEGPLQLGFPGQASLYFNDPSGNHLEIVCAGFGQDIPIRPPEMTKLAWDGVLVS